MFHPIVFMKIALISLLFTLGSDAIAFTFQLAPDDGTTNAFDTHTQFTPDIPTPQFFRLLFKQDTLTLDLEQPFGRPLPSAPHVRAFPIDSSPSAPSSAQPSSNQQHYLSGIEVFLLRDTQRLVDQINP
jgi:hypothetical protein